MPYVYVFLLSCEAVSIDKHKLYLAGEQQIDPDLCIRKFICGTVLSDNACR